VTETEQELNQRIRNKEKVENEYFFILFIFLFSAISNEKIWIYHLSQASKPFIFLYFFRSNFFKRFWQV